LALPAGCGVPAVTQGEMQSISAAQKVAIIGQEMVFTVLPICELSDTITKTMGFWQEFMRRLSFQLQATEYR
jgi:hypothetical protein